MDTKSTKTCKTCKNNYPIEYFYKNGNKYRALSCKYCKYTSIKKQDISNFTRISINNAKTRANKKGLEFNLTVNWYINNLPKYCPVFNTKLDFTSDLDEAIPSIDRINSAKGYTEDNCRIISWKANRIKNQWTVDELAAVVAYLKQL